MIPFLRAAVFSILVVAAGCQSAHNYPGAKTENDEVVTASGLRYIDMVEGTGDVAITGMRVTVHCTGYLMDGKKFFSSLDNNEPLPFVLGAGKMIRGWDEGIPSMRVGGQRKLIIPPQLAYETRGIPGLIPPDATLVFDIQLLSVNKPNE